jgi:UDP-GlcNAc:undecaprenyl-phosphate/decaprenyl-phosphate GlcNAc-1-phosphate transferase
MLRIDVEALYGLAIALPLVAAMVLTPLAARVARRYEVLDHPAEGKHHQEVTPYLGGFAAAVALVAVGGVAAGAEGQLGTVLLGGVALTILGLIDDQRTVPMAVKLVVEIAAGIGLWLSGIGAGLFGVMALDLMLTVAWVVAITNAINLLDNMDGLAAGVTAISALTFFGISAQAGHHLVGSLSLAVAGASLGFLVHNFPPAKIFLGDSGTLLFGFLLAALGLKLDLVGPNGFVRTAIPILALSVPIFDMLVVVITRARERRPIYLGGLDHTSHRLARRGLSARAVALVHYVAQAALSGLAIALFHAVWGVALAVVLGTGAVAAIGLGVVLRLPYGRKPEDSERIHEDAPRGHMAIGEKRADYSKADPS